MMYIIPSTESECIFIKRVSTLSKYIYNMYILGDAGDAVIVVVVVGNERVSSQ